MSNQNILERLPPEIWHKVVENLPLSSKGLISICCRYMYHCIGNRWLELLTKPRLPSTSALGYYFSDGDNEDAKARIEQASRGEKLRFMRGLRQSLPNHHYCTDCEVFHLNANVHETTRCRMHAVGEATSVCSDFATIKIYPGVTISWQELYDRQEWETIYGSCDWNKWMDLPLYQGWQGRIETWYRGKYCLLMALVVLERPITLDLLQDMHISTFPTCQHLQNPIRLQEACKDLLEDFKHRPAPWTESPEDDAENVVEEFIAFECSLCASMYRLEVVPESSDGSENGISLLRFERCMRFDQMYSPHVIEWYALTHPYVSHALEKPVTRMGELLQYPVYRKNVD